MVLRGDGIGQSIVKNKNHRFELDATDSRIAEEMGYEYDYYINGWIEKEDDDDYAYGGFINKSEMSKIEQSSYSKAVMKGISIIGSSDGITFSTRNENLAYNLAKAFSDIGYDTKVVSIGGGENYVVWVKKTYADGGMMAKGGKTKAINKRWNVVTKGHGGREVSGIITLGVDSNVSDVKRRMREMGYNSKSIISIESMEKGGVVYVDLFEDYENIPKKVGKILDRYYDRYGEDMDYKHTENMLEEVEEVGYTFDYYLDNIPYGLRPIGVELNQLRGYEDMD
jgi:hypothetical protein